jgi:hypothetical protein
LKSYSRHGTADTPAADITTASWTLPQATALRGCQQREIIP